MLQPNCRPLLIIAEAGAAPLDGVIVAVVVLIFSQEPSNGDRSDTDGGNRVTECNIFITSYITDNVTI